MRTLFFTFLLVAFQCFANPPVEDKGGTAPLIQEEDEEDVAYRDNLKDTLYDSNERRIQRQDREYRQDGYPQGGSWESNDGYYPSGYRSSPQSSRAIYESDVR